MQTTIEEIIANADLMPQKIEMYDSLRFSGFDPKEARSLAADYKLPYSTVYSWSPEVKGAVPLEVKIRDYAAQNDLILDSSFDSSIPAHRDILRVGFLSYFTGSRLAKKHNEVRLTCHENRLDSIKSYIQESGLSYNLQQKGKSRTFHVESGNGNCFGYFIKGLLPQLQQSRSRMIKPPNLCPHDYQPFLEAMFATKACQKRGLSIALVTCQDQQEQELCKEAYQKVFEHEGITPKINGGRKVGIYISSDQIPSWYVDVSCTK